MSEDQEIGRLGRGLVVANQRLGRILTLLESHEPAASPGALPALLDLLDAVSAAIASELPPAAADGLRLATARCEEALAAMSILPIPTAGPPDPYQHTVIGVSGDGDHATISHTHRRGWLRDGEPPTVLRAALVDVRRTHS